MSLAGPQGLPCSFCQICRLAGDLGNVAAHSQHGLAACGVLVGLRSVGFVSWTHFRPSEQRSTSRLLSPPVGSLPNVDRMLTRRYVNASSILEFLNPSPETAFGTTSPIPKTSGFKDTSKHLSQATVSRKYPTHKVHRGRLLRRVFPMKLYKALGRQEGSRRPPNQALGT